jgi:hypothetical protein
VECPRHSVKAIKHSVKPLPSATLGIPHGKILVGKEDFAECFISGKISDVVFVDKMISN